MTGIVVLSMVGTRISADQPISFTNDVMPILSKYSCDAGGCHGKATGQNGFRLSLFGGDAEFSHRSIVLEAKGRRVFPASPENSLLLRKATAVIAHGGGRRLTEDSVDYEVLSRWMREGLTGPHSGERVLERIEMSPPQLVLQPHARQQISVAAFYSDGFRRDVTSWALYSVNTDGIVEVSTEGMIQVGNQGGLAAVTVKFGELAGTVQLIVPYSQTPDQQEELSNTLLRLQQQSTMSKVDVALMEQWKRLQIQPADICDDATFIRRVSVDICGTLPTASEVKAFVADATPDKRRLLVDRLLERPEYASYFGLKWADILQNRGKGYSTSQQRPGTVLFANWIRDSLLENKPYDEFVTEILTATGSQRLNPPTVWYRSVRTIPNYVESVAQAFLGLRIQCAQCHHHPADRWSQADYFGLAANFSRVGRKGGFADAEVPTGETIYVLDEGVIRHPQTQQVLKPEPLGDPAFEISVFDDPRVSLARWMTAPENPFFADAMVNRMWAHFFSRGIIHPVDDRRETNPPVNPELLDALSEEFVDSGFDLKHLIRVICNCCAYQLDSVANAGNQHDKKTFSRFYPRRMTAEVLLDAISQTLQVPTRFPGGPGEFPLGTRAIELPDENVAVGFLDVFGRPARFKACECERIDAPTLSQGLEIVNSKQIQEKLMSPDGFVQQLVGNQQSAEMNSRLVFWTLLGRAPSDEELAVAVSHLANRGDTEQTLDEKRTVYQNLIWALLATNEFMFVK